MIRSGILLFVRTLCSAAQRVVRVSGNESHCKNKSLTIFVMGIDVFVGVVVLFILYKFSIKLSEIKWTAFISKR